MPIHRRLPKRGFTNIFKKKIAIVNVRDLNRFEAGTVVDEILLLKNRMIKGSIDGVKLLGKGDLDRPLTVRLENISNGAKDKIIASGGSIESAPVNEAQ